MTRSTERRSTRPDPFPLDGRELRRILLQQGFAQPDHWLDYAREHRLRRVDGEVIEACPYCSSTDHGLLGRYVYYSHLIGLRSCGGCGLVFADRRIQPDLVKSHFEAAYKDDEYFSQHRSRIFGHLAGIVDSVTAQGGRVIDVGGATGVLSGTILARRPDLDVTVTDLSETACRAAMQRWDLRAVQGRIEDLHGIGSFDVAVFSDVIYYEENVGALFRNMARLVVDGGQVVIRVPNRLGVIRAAAKLRRGFGRGGHDDRLAFHNPEHVYIFSRTFLERELRSHGFTAIRVESSPMLRGGRLSHVAPVVDRVARRVARLTGGRLVLSPALVLVATRSDTA